MTSPLHGPGVHESGEGHVQGSAVFVDDLQPRGGELFGLAVLASEGPARILGIGARRAALCEGIHGIYFAEDIPGANNVGPVFHDEPLLAAGEVAYPGAIVALVVGDNEDACREAAALVEIELELLPAIRTIEEAIEAESYLSEPLRISRGDIKQGLATAPLCITGELHSGAQDHLYLETHVAIAIPEDGGSMRVLASTQHPTEVQSQVAELLALGRHRVVVECPRMGGAFGGKESQGSWCASLAALGAHHTRRAVRVRFDRDLDMITTGKRHPWLSRYEAGFDDRGHLLALRVRTWPDGGHANDLSLAILQRCLFHLDGAYYIPHIEVEGRVVRTHSASNTAFRGFGGPQGVLVVESILDRIAARLSLDPTVVRRRNLYEAGGRDITHFEQAVEEPRLVRIHDELLASSDYESRRQAISSFNADSKWRRRGIAFIPVKFGISFTTRHLNQAGALLLVYTDGTVQLNHGGTEMGQGLHSKMLAVCAHELGIGVDRIRVMWTATDKVPNTSATAASSGSDLNGEAIKRAAAILRDRLRPVAARCLGLEEARGAELIFESGQIRHPKHEEKRVAFERVAEQAWLDRVSLAATGYYRTPDVGYDFESGEGRPFHYFAFGGAVVELEIDGRTGESRLSRVDILHDCGSSLLPSIDLGQIEGGFIQGYGWLTMEELVRDDEGHVLTHGPSTYKIPAIGDCPADFRVKLLEKAEQKDVIHGSKAVGEPPLLLGLGALTALRQAISTFGPHGHEVDLALPATAESILRAVERAREAGRHPESSR